MAFGDEQRALQVGIAAVAADLSARGDDAVVRQARLLSRAKNVADGAGRSRFPGEPGDVAVRRHAAGGNPAQNRQHPPRERRHRRRAQ